MTGIKIAFSKGSSGYSCRWCWSLQHQQHHQQILTEHRSALPNHRTWQIFHRTWINSIKNIERSNINQIANCGRTWIYPATRRKTSRLYSVLRNLNDKKTFFYVCKIVISSRLFSSEGSPERRDPGLALFPSLATVAH